MSAQEVFMEFDDGGTNTSGSVLLVDHQSILIHYYFCCISFCIKSYYICFFKNCSEFHIFDTAGGGYPSTDPILGNLLRFSHPAAITLGSRGGMGGGSID